MMLVKAANGDDTWELFAAHSELAYSGALIDVEIDWVIGDGTVPPTPVIDIDMSDDRFPDADLMHLHLKQPPIYEGRTLDYITVRWVRWRNEQGETEVLITAFPVYICNANGDTVEALR